MSRGRRYDAIRCRSMRSWLPERSSRDSTETKEATQILFNKCRALAMVVPFLSDHRRGEKNGSRFV